MVELNPEAPLFVGVSSAALEDIAKAASSVSIARGNTFFNQGDEANFVFYLVEGQVKLSQISESGEQVTPRTVGNGKIFGGVAAFGQRPYPVSAVALSPATALRWKGEGMRKLMKDYPRLALNALDIVSKRLHDLQDRYHELATEQVAIRLRKALLRLAETAGKSTPIQLDLSRQDLAEMTGTTLFSVSRILKTFEKDGLLGLGREKVVILDMARLEDDLEKNRTSLR